MMEYLRNYLIFLRRKENENLKMKPSIFMLLVSLVGISIGFLLDYLLPHSYFTNMLRGVVSVATGAALFSFSYLCAVKLGNKKMAEDRFYQTMRERFSHKQRINFSIAIGAFAFGFILLSGDASLIFTLKSSLAFFVGLSLITFSRKNRSEFIKGIYEIPDVRDLEASKEKKAIVEKLKSSKTKKK